MIVLGLVLGSLWRLSDRVRRLEAKLGVDTAEPEGPNAGADAERERIRRKMAGYAGDAGGSK